MYCMHIVKAVQKTLLQLADSIQNLTCEEYNYPSKTLFDATIGKHVRHILELFIELHIGYETGQVNYENRKRNMEIETDPETALKNIENIFNTLDKRDKELVLVSNYDLTSEETILIQTNYTRELVYNLEHAIHHMAIIRIGMGYISRNNLPVDYGVAISTLKHSNACAL